MHRFLVVIGIIVLSLQSMGQATQQPTRVSLVQLIANPDQYDGKLVSVVGYLTFNFDNGDNLYFHKDDYLNMIDANGISVGRTKQMLKDREKLYDNYVIIVGVFRRRQLPPIYVSNGEITGVQRCDVWSQPDHPIANRLKELHGGEPKQ